MDMFWTLLAILMFVVLVLVLRYLLRKKLRRGERGKVLWKKTKNGVKVMLASAQITASLPQVIPAVTLPKSYEAVVSAMQFTNLNPFTFISVGCFTGGFNFYHQTLGLVLPVTLACAIILLLGVFNTSRRQRYFTMAIALTYLTLPSITTSSFALFPCDDLDNGQKLLRVDLRISCNETGRVGWEAFGYLTILLYPVGVTALYSILLYQKRARLAQDVEARFENEETRGIVFLWEPYKPEFFYFEVVETVRRLAMTGVLSIIDPGSFTQLTTGLIISCIHTAVLCFFKPYQEARDNNIGILSSALIVLTFISSSLTKYQKGLVDSDYDAKGLGIVLVLATALIAMLFVVWAWQSIQDLGRSSVGMAVKVSMGSGSGSSVKESYGIELTKRDSDFKAENPLHGQDESEEIVQKKNKVEKGNQEEVNTTRKDRPEKKSFAPPPPPPMEEMPEFVAVKLNGKYMKKNTITGEIPELTVEEARNGFRTSYK